MSIESIEQDAFNGELEEMAVYGLLAAVESEWFESLFAPIENEPPIVLGESGDYQN